MAESRPPVTVFTFFLELPRALPTPDNLVNFSLVERDSHWDGWSDDDVADVFGFDGSRFPSGFAPSAATTIRHADLTDLPVGLLAEEVFANWIDELLPSSVGQRHAARARQAHCGSGAVRSVVALSRFIPRSAHPRGDEMQVSWLHAEFRRALGAFNEFLDAFGFVLERWEIGPLALRDLPAQVPVLIASTQRRADGASSAVTFTAQIHDGLPVAVGELAEDLGPVEEAIELNNRARDREQPFMLVYRFLRAAESERLAGDAARAVVDLTTAVEVLVSVILDAGSELLGVAPDKVGWTDRDGVKVKVRKHLAPMLGKRIDTGNADTPWGRWFGDGYVLRNRAVHAGVVVEEADIERAFLQVREIFREIKVDLESRPPLTPLGQLFELDESWQEPETTDKLVEIRFPWD